MKKTTTGSLAMCSLSLAMLAIASAVAAPGNAQVNPLQVRMAAVSAKAGDFQGPIEITITNTSNQAVRIPSWELPSEFPESRQFRITRNGQPVAYQGMLVKRGAPQASDFVVIGPHQSIKRVIDLSASYDLSTSGNYDVALATRLQYASLSDGARLHTDRGTPMQLLSAPVRVWVDGSDLLGAAKAGDKGKGKPGGGANVVVNGVSYESCSTTQINTLGSAVTAARNYSENAKGYLNSGTNGPRYKTWFGAYTSSRYNTAKQHFTAIDSALDQNAGQLKINCGCNQSYYAYVYPDQPYQIYVCRAFWTAPLTGTDSKAGTLVHETSHFNVVAGTDDVVYGQSGAKNLALTDPNGALNNADSHEYFSENTPAQN